MKPQWILVANGSLARIFSRMSAADPLVAIDTIDFADGRLKGADLERDRQGHERSDTSSASTHFESRTSLSQKRHHRFARILSQRLDQAWTDGAFASLWIVASSPLLGEVRTALSRHVAERVKLVHEADYTGMDLGALETRLHDLHPPPTTRRNA